MLTVIGVITFLVSFIILYSVFKIWFSSLFAVQKRVDLVIDSNEVLHEEKSIFQALQAKRSEMEKAKRSLKKDTIQSSRLQKQLEESGLIKKFTAGQWTLVKNGTCILVCAFVFLLGLIANGNLGLLLLLILFIFMMIQVLFRFYLMSCITQRRKDILRMLPYTLDLVTVSVEAGLSFDGAIAKVMDATDNVLTYEFSKALKEMRMGIERKRALRALSDRCNVKELTTVVNALIQADDLGVSLGKVLRIQSDQVREFRKQSAREKSMQAPVKMLFPLIFFIFPTVLIIILGPAIIQILTFFK
jgi:tight adherence protein C